MYYRCNVLWFWIIPSHKTTMSAFKTRLEFGSKDVEILISSVCPVRGVYSTEWSGEAESVVWPRCEMWPVADRRLQDGLVLPYPGRDSPRLQIPVLTRPMLSPPLPELLPYHRHRHVTLTCFCHGSCVKNELLPGFRWKRFRETLRNRILRTTKLRPIGTHQIVTFWGTTFATE